MKPSTLSLLFCALILTGCHTNYLAPGTHGKVIDADTKMPIGGALVTRPAVSNKMFGGQPATSAVTDKRGNFAMRPACRTQIAFMYVPNPKDISSTFVITAKGYSTNEVPGSATAETLWRADLGKVALKKQ